MKSIVCLHSLTPDQIGQIGQAAPGFDLIVKNKKDVSAEQIQNAEVILGWSKTIAEEALREYSKLKWVQTWSAGVDTLPLERLRDKGVLLTSASGVHAIPISESIIGMMLSFSRQLHMAVRHQLKKEWKSDLAVPGLGTLGEISGKTLVIVGVGEIGRETARLAKAFGLRVIGVRRSDKPEPHVDRMYKMDNLHEALGQGDYIVNILPLTAETRHMFNAAAWNAAKKGAYFINVGRGPTVDTASLINALNSGRLSGAGLDVFEEEPLPAEHPLWEMEQVIITPHVAGSNDRYAERVIDIFADNLKAYVQGQKPPRNLVDYGRMY
ncbi:MULTISPECIES: D-2-hydroxyacid dehydrogenase [Paenibacillus]|uniref:3-phosphoglycerate dehydrogenase n=1 Tax=Paenibacillus albilobatus TaxID=2716884 RepID=A0A919XK74_9BACL|nr:MULTISPECIES: D-2-hydroxyacid dehydrogenase [Paenibacillus]GIO31985.1 3-phosphoglycerate dehydrogenase [Paenibacillus albilobatus]